MSVSKVKKVPKNLPNIEDVYRKLFSGVVDDNFWEEEKIKQINDNFNGLKPKERSALSKKKRKPVEPKPKPEKQICDCGQAVYPKYMNIHLNSKKHQLAIEKKNNNVEQVPVK